MVTRSSWLVAAGAFAVSAMASGLVVGETMERVSLDSAGEQGNAASFVGSSSAKSSTVLSSTGSTVAFASDATNLVSGDTNGVTDVFVRNRLTGVTTRISVSSAGVEGNGVSLAPSVSPDGRYVVFSSSASNLVSGDTNATQDVFLRDLQTGTTSLVSVSSGGNQGNSESSGGAISSGGRYVVFDSVATNLVTGDTNGDEDVFIRDIQTGTTSRVSVSSSGVQGNLESDVGAISSDGRVVAFCSKATNLVADDTNSMVDVFARDLQTGTTTLVSVSPSGAQGLSHSLSICLGLSSDGRYVAFSSQAWNFATGDSNGWADIFVRDRQAGTTTLVSTSPSGFQFTDLSYCPSISADGHLVAFTVFSPTEQVYVNNRNTGATECVSSSPSGGLGNHNSEFSSMSADGRFVAFQSVATNLVTGDTNSVEDVFVRGGFFAPALSINDISLTETDIGIVNATMTVSLSASSQETITVHWATEDSYAVAPYDYDASSGDLTFSPEETSKQLVVPVKGDPFDEFNEVFYVNLTSPVNATIADAQGVVTIIDDDATPTLSIGDASITEGDTGIITVSLTVTVSAPSGQYIGVHWATADSFAVAPYDYVASSGDLTFDLCEVTKQIDIPVKCDPFDEFDEIFYVNLTSPANATIADARGVVTIIDDDATPTLSIGDASITEGDSGTTTVTLTVTLSAPSGQYVGVHWGTAEGSAVAPSDYATASGDLSFDLCEVSKQVDVPVAGDDLDEPDESFLINLTNPSNASIDDGQGTATILDNDPMADASASDVTTCEGMPAKVVVSLGVASGWAVSVDYATADGSAVEGADYVPAIGTATIPAGATTATVEVPTISDWTPNCGKSFTLEFSNPDNAVLLTPAATVTICDDEATCGIFSDGFETGDVSAWLVGDEQ